MQETAETVVKKL